MPIAGDSLARSRLPESLQSLQLLGLISTWQRAYIHFQHTFTFSSLDRGGSNRAKTRQEDPKAKKEKILKTVLHNRVGDPRRAIVAHPLGRSS